MLDGKDWVRRYAVRPAARVRLFCFPHAGGSASAFRPWQALLPPEVELAAVQYPGREDRFGQPMAHDLHELAARVCDDLAAGLLDRPYVLLGHSMGAVAAYQVAQELRRRGQRLPARLVACARQSPEHSRDSGVHRGDDRALVAELERLGGTPPEVLADPELRRVILGIVRNDYRLAETYAWRAEPPLDCPISVFVGDTDPECSADEGAQWVDMTTGSTEVTIFRGDHFFLTPQRRAVVATLLRILYAEPGRAESVWPSTP